MLSPHGSRYFGPRSRRIHVLLLTLFVLLPIAAHCRAQEPGRLRLLAGTGEKLWRADSVQSPSGTATGSWTVRFRHDGTMAISEGSDEWRGSWTFDDDGSAIIVTGLTSGTFRRKDTVWMDVVALKERSLELEYRNSFGLVHARYEPDESFSEGSDTAGFAAFWNTFKMAVAKGNRKAVASMTSFPFISHDLPGFIHRPKHGPEFTRAEFLRYFNQLFDRTARRTFPNAVPTPMMDADTVTNFAVGIRSLKTATVWVEFWRNEKGEWKLTRTDNVSYSSGDDD
ncbi:MAG: hypothetical protein JST22_02315 [Bacteroidetes bacterium]|nr:hypothetical protein [Bacteroidota bacterium]